MPGENIYSWLVSAINNGNADSSINWLEGMPRAAVNNSGRSMMAAAAKNRNLLTGQVITGGTANAQTFISGIGFVSGTDTIPTNFRCTLKTGPGANTGPVTLAMDGFAAANVVKQGGAALNPGELAQGVYADFIYDGTNWVLQNVHETTLAPPVTITRQVLTAGSGTYTLPTGCTAIEVEMVAGGGGGAGALDQAGSTGGSTIFGAIFCLGGGGGAPNGSSGGAGGTATGGDINVQGGQGAAGQTQVGNTTVIGGNGGSSAFGGAGGGAGGGGTAGFPGMTNSGGGGGGGSRFLNYAGSGGGAGGYLRKLILNPAPTYPYVVGVGGAAGVDSAGFWGGTGGTGVIIVTQYFTPLLTGGGGLSDAPSDGHIYGRLNAAWVDAWASPTFTGTAQAPTVGGSDNSSAIATTAWVTTKLGALGVFTASVNGLVPASGGGTLNFLRADGTWQQPPSGGGGSGITSINTMTGPGISIAAGTGISINNASNTVTINSTAVSQFTTGDIKWTHKVTADAGWVLWQDGTIGNASSGGTIRANADTSALFALYFNSYNEADVPLQNSAGTVITRASQGNNATTAFNANCRQSLPKGSGRLAGLAGSGSGLTTRIAGNTLGAESASISILGGNLPSHNHGPAAQSAGFITTAGFAAGSDGNLEFTNPGSTQNVGGGLPITVSIMSPCTFLNAMIKL